MRITSTGQVRLAGAGITFNGDTATANELDDYEEGTWTPTIVGSVTAGTASYSTQVGSYTKIGQQVTVQFHLVYTGGTGTGNLRVSGLPFTAGSVSARVFVGAAVLVNITTTALHQAYYSIAENTAYINVDQFPLGGGGVNNVTYDAAGAVVGTITYFV
jgi:hypothetical protein